MANSTRKPPRSPVDESPSPIVTWTVLAVIASVAVSYQWLTPILLSAPIAFLLAGRRNRIDYASTRALLLKWSLTVLIAYVVTCAFVPARAAAGAPFGSSISHSFEDWLGGGAAWNVAWISTAAVVFVAMTTVSGGVLALPVFAALLSNAAVSAASIYAIGHNVIETSLVALSPWQWTMLAGSWVLITPLAIVAPARLRRHEIKPPESVVKRDLIVGFGLLAMALFLRLLASGVYETAVRRLSVT